METLENNINITFVEISENLKNKKEFIDYSKLKEFTIVICDLSIDNEQELVMTQLKKVNLNKEVCFLLFDKKGYCINNNWWATRTPPRPPSKNIIASRETALGQTPRHCLFFCVFSSPACKTGPGAVYCQRHEHPSQNKTLERRSHV